MTHPIPPAVQEVLDLFEGDLALVKFGDLEEAVLSSASEEVLHAAQAVAHAEATLASLRAVLSEKQEGLLQKAQRALAYARVYAEGDDALWSRVEQIALPRAAKRLFKLEGTETDASIGATHETRRRGRPRKLAASGDLLERPSTERSTDIPSSALRQLG